MKIGIQSDTYDRYGQDRYKMMVSDGYSFCDLALYDTDGELYHCDEDRFGQMLREELSLAQEAGIGFYQVHGPSRYPPRDATEEDRAERKEKMETCFRAAKLLGCPHVVLHPIMPFGTKVDPDPEKVIEMNVDFFRSLLPAARENGVTVCVENMPMSKLSVSYPESILRVVRAINDPNMAFCLDTGHSIVKGVQPGEAVRSAGGLLKALHVHDSDGQRDRHWVPGTGAIDWADFCESLKEIGYAGVMNLETNLDMSLPPEQYREACRCLAQIARKLAE